MLDLHLFSCISFILCIFVPLIFFTIPKRNPSINSSTKLVKSYPIFGSAFEIFLNKNRFIQWSSKIVNSAPNLTYSLDVLFGKKFIMTSNAANVEHILKTNSDNYGKGNIFKTLLGDAFGETMFILDGESFKDQRQLISLGLNTKSLQQVMETIIEDEVFGRLIPVLKHFADIKTEIDLQDVLERFSFDVICRVAFDYDPGYLLPLSLHEKDFAEHFGKVLRISFERLFSISPYVWKTKRALNIGSEKHLKIAINHLKEFAMNVVREKKKQLDREPSVLTSDVLSRFLSSKHYTDEFITYVVLGLTMAGRDTTSSALTWFFWLLSDHPEVEKEILNEIKGQSELCTFNYDDVKRMIYTHASLCESMRLYPPVPLEIKQGFKDDVLPDGTVVKKGTRVIALHIYAMGRVETVWGSDWAKFKPTRWLEKEQEGEKLRFVSRDSFTYPVFLAGARTCLGKNMAFFQMKKIVAAVLERFKVVPVKRGGGEPAHEWAITNRMKEGFKVRIEERNNYSIQ